MPSCNKAFPFRAHSVLFSTLKASNIKRSESIPVMSLLKLEWWWGGGGIVSYPQAISISPSWVYNVSPTIYSILARMKLIYQSLLHFPWAHFPTGNVHRRWRAFNQCLPLTGLKINVRLTLNINYNIALSVIQEMCYSANAPNTPNDHSFPISCSYLNKNS